MLFLFAFIKLVERKVGKDINHRAIMTISCSQFCNGGKIAGSPSLTLTASLSCLYAWRILTLGCLHSLIMNTAVFFGRGPEVVWRGQGAGFISRGE